MSVTSRRGGRKGVNFSIDQDIVDAEIAAANENARTMTHSQERTQKSAVAWWKRFLKAVGKSIEPGGYIPSELVITWVWVSLRENRDDGSFTGPEYSVLTLRDTYTPALLRWFTASGYTYEPTLQKQINIKVQTMLKEHQIGTHQHGAQTGSNPICTWDIKRVIERLPIGWRMHTDVLAWLVIGHHLGQRGVTLVHIRWKDMRIVACADEDTDNPLVQISITLRVGKGNASWYVTSEPRSP